MSFNEVVYHGTSQSFVEFDARPVFLTSNFEMAKGYANRSGPGGKVIEVRLNLKNPLSLDFLAPNTAKWYENKRRVWKNKGYDGVVVGGNVFIAFSPEQIEIVARHRAEN